MATVSETAAAFAEHVAASERRTMVFVTSQLGSISQAAGVRRYAYRNSKAGLNMAARILALELVDRVRVSILHPAHVATDMGGQAAPVSPRESGRGMRRIADRLTDRQSGTFLDWRGRPLPW